MNYFITGTDTDCGKTYVTDLLVRAARAEGLDAVAAKPFCCGSREDVEILSAANGGILPPDVVNPVWLKTPAAPLACQLLGEKPADLAAALGGMRALASRHDHVCCEGAGGWLVPLLHRYSMADFAAELGWPILLVARNKLGVLNHALLTIENIRQRGLKLAGVVLNHAEAAEDPATRTNRKILEDVLGHPLLAAVPRGAKVIDLPPIFRG